MPNNKYYVLLFFLSGLMLTAQTRPQTQVVGIVTNRGIGVPDVHVMNLSKNQATITDQEGRFFLAAKTGDTLLFSAVQLQRRSLVLSEDMLLTPLLLVPLEEFVNALDEVILRPYNLSGDLEQDLANGAGPVKVASTMGLPNAYAKPRTQAERKLFEASTGGGIIPLNPILNGISGRTKYLKKVLARERKYSQTEKVRYSYPDSVYIKELKLPADRIDDFFYFCEVDPEFSALVTGGDALRTWEYLVLKSKAYRKANDLD
ncbi:hypothetical protein [Zeaxanthinibacter enoshimensis]|nr:hypothetical protein [Zeaxanthinibacter enoshimensis]